MAGRRKPLAPSRPPSTAPLPRASSPANSAAATAPVRSPPPCCARSMPRSRPRLGSAHHLVGHFPRPLQAAPQARRAQVGAKRRGVRPMNAQDLLQEIADYCRHSGLAESTFGRRAVNDGKLTARLRNGGRITTETLDRIRGFMETNRTAVARPTVIER